MATIYRRARGPSPPPPPPPLARAGVTATSADGRPARRPAAWRRCLARGGDAPVLRRAARTLWLAALVYAFWGLPALARLLAGVRHAQRFRLPALLAGLAAGALQDAAVFLQASTLLYFVKLLLDPPGADAASAAAERRFPNSGFLRAPPARLPRYRPVLPAEYDSVADPAPRPRGNAHRTLLASSPLAWRARLPRGLSRLPAAALSARTPSARPAAARALSAPAAALAAALRRALVAALLLATVVLATVASVADFCLQVGLHPRLDRARAHVFLSCLSQFAAALLERAAAPSGLGEAQELGLYDDGDLPRAVVFSWGVYAALVAALTVGFFTGRLPLLPDVLRVSSARGGGGGGGWLCGCWPRGKLSARKDSQGLGDVEDAAAAPSRPPNRCERLRASLAWCWACLWLSDADQASTARARRRSGGSFSLSGSNGGALALAAPSTAWPSAPTAAASVAYALSPAAVHKPVATLWRGVLSTILATLAALLASLALEMHAGVDMRLMANALFALETENLVARATGGAAALTERHVVNCTSASQTLLDALDGAEGFAVADMGNDDRCALLWRDTTSFRGDAIVDLPNRTHADHWRAMPSRAPSLEGREGDDDSDKEGDGDGDGDGASEQPNIIVIHMASWRHLDVGVLGGQSTKKRRAPLSVTPQFDALAASGVLFTSHYTPCVTSTPCTLLTTLFGMQPPCADPSASPFNSLKHFVGTSTAAGLDAPPSVQVRGLPQFLKQRGYQNVFWRATDLARDHEAEFLTLNGFDKLVDDRKVRQLLRDVRAAMTGDAKVSAQDDDDHVGAGIHDHLSFEMLLFAIEEAHNASMAVAATNASDVAVTNSNSSTVDVGAANATIVAAGARDATMAVTAAVLDANASDAVVLLNVSAVKGRHYHPAASLAPLTTAASSANATTASNASLSIADGDDVEVEAAAAATMAPVSTTAGLRAPFFIDMYSISSQSPYRVPRAFSRSSSDLAGLTTRFDRKYLQAMHFSDAVLGRFIAELRAKGLMKNTVVVITGDHGDGKLEHVTNPTARDSGVFDEVARIPFLLLADDLLADADKGRRVDHLTTQMDLMATVADLLGVSAARPLRQHGVGRSMLRAWPSVPRGSDRGGDDKEEEEEEGKDEAARWIDDMRGVLLSGEGPGGVAAAAEGDDARRSAARESPHGRRALLCNPFGGGTKGVRTSRDELKFVFFPDRSFSVFDEAADPRERAPARHGFDLDDMDADTHAQLDFADEQLDLHAFLYQANKFVGDDDEEEKEKQEEEEAEEIALETEASRRPSNATR